MTIPSLILSLRDAGVYYPDGSGGIRRALSEVNLEIRQGDWLSVTGSNGSGKSTLAGVLLGICPLSAGKLHRRNGLRIRTVLQHPEAQVLGDTLEEEFNFVTGDDERPSEELNRLLADALIQIGLNLRPDHPLSELSGGQKQLVNIAAALASQPDLLILDEPTAMLDPAIRETFLQAVQRAHASGMTIVWITHRMEEAAAGDRILALDSGSVAFNGTPEAFFYGGNAHSAGIEYAREAPCDLLGLEPPFVVLTVRVLLAKGVPVLGHPLKLNELAKAVIESCP